MFISFVVDVTAATKWPKSCRIECRDDFQIVVTFCAENKCYDLLAQRRPLVKIEAASRESLRLISTDLNFNVTNSTKLGMSYHHHHHLEALKRFRSKMVFNRSNED